MKSGKCPKCGSTEVYTKKDGFQVDLSIGLRFGNVKQGRFEDYLCMGCGYSERYLTNLAELTELPKHWTKAGR